MTNVLGAGLSPIITSSKSLFEGIYLELQGPATGILAAAFGCWFAWTVIYHLMLKGDLNLPRFVIGIAVVTTAAYFISDIYAFKEFFYEPYADFFNGLCTSVANVGARHAGSTLGGEEGAMGVLQAVENSIWQVTGVIWSGSTKGFWGGLRAMAFCVLMFIPFFFSAVLYGLHYFEYIMKTTIIFGLGPILILCAAFTKTRRFATGAINILLHGGVTIVVSSVFAGMMSLGVNQLMTGYVSSPVELGGMSLEGLKNAYKLLFLGYVFALAQLKAPTIAANITGATDSPGVTGAMAAGFTAMAGGMGKAAAMAGVSGGSKVAGWGAGKALDVVKNGTAAEQARAKGMRAKWEDKSIDMIDTFEP